MGIDRLAWRTVLSRPLRSFLTIVGIALGVGVLSASLTLGAALDAAVDRTVHEIVGRSDLRVSAFLEAGLSDAAIQTIRDTAGVETVAPVIEQRTFLGSRVDGATTDSLAVAANAVTVLGIDPSSYAEVHDLALVGGKGLATADEPVAVITERLASQDGYGLGSQLTILGAGDEQHLRIIGIVSGFGPLGGSGRTIIVPIEVAHRAFQLEGATRVDLRLAPHHDVPETAARLAATMTEPYVLASPADLERSLRASSANFQGTAALVAAIVLFVGAFLIVNTLSMTVGERAREVGLLRAAGATRGQAGRFVFTGALVLGILGSGIGLLIGAALALLMADTVSLSTGLAATVPGIDPTDSAIAFCIGVAITVLAAIEPAVRAAGISPVEALRARIDLPSARRSRLGWVVAVFIVVAALALLAWPPAIAATGAERALAVYGVLLLATLVSSFLMRPLARALGVPIALVLRLEERLSRGSLARDRNRTALTLGSLVVGLAMVVALGWSAEAARASAVAWLTDVIPGDEIVSSIRPVASDEGIREVLTEVPGVATVTPIASFDVAFRGIRLDAAAVDGAAMLADGRLTAVAGDRVAALNAIDAGGAAILPRAVANHLGLHVGDSMALALGGGDKLDLRVAAIVDRSIPGSGGEAVLVGWKDAAEHLGVLGADAFAVRLQPGAGQAARDALTSTAKTYALEANPIERIEGAVSEALARVFGVFDALAIVAVIVAALGIVNTLTMSVVERIRELGVLRAIGMSRRQATRVVIVEAGLLGVVGVVLGSLAGIAVGAVMLALGGGLGPVAGVPWLPIELAAGLGLVLPVVAAVYPSRMAARISIVEALQFE
jgi:putative ABC transport system permease protein